VEIPAGPDAAEAERISGLLKIGPGNGLLVEAVPGEVPAAGTPVGGIAAATPLAVILLGAILGGLLLNIMPCVFPILSLKALSLAKSGGEEGAARREALAYAGGAVVMCLALGGSLLALRAGGAAVGWAFQLQDPRMIFLLLMLFTAITANLAGLFELPALAIGSRRGESGGAAGAFGTGALAAFVATPCTGPFMAAALGAALILPPIEALAIFAGLGLGLALPFLAIGFVPALRRRLPRPGPWLARFRRWMALPMGLTALALVWLLSRQAGAEGVTIGFGLAIALVLVLGWIGLRQRKGRAAALLAIPALLVAAVGVGLMPSALPATERAADTLPGAEPFSTARLAELRAAGRPVFVYFTADWCITCKANEAGALARQSVAAHFQQREIAVLVGDWTTGNAEIGRFLATHGRSGVPLYLYYPPGGEPEILPQILTPGRLLALGE
ncbi:MAG: protein-disulfide reductase DsbD family protein, partial [Parasphingopyxis sp.]